MRKLIFDLDRTLWRYTVEYHPRIIIPPIGAETRQVLSHLQKKGHSLNIASRSNEPEKCNYFLDTFFPDIKFDTRAIYYTPKTKLEHIWEISQDNENFIMFDDEIEILKPISILFPDCNTVLCKKPIDWDIIDKIS